MAGLVPKRRWKMVLGTIGVVAIAIGVFLSASSDPPPNILLITLDTTRADRLGCYGYAAAHTPRLDELAGRSVLFERAYAPAPLTLPSHASILTGLWPPEHGIPSNGQYALTESIPTLTEAFRLNRYATAAFVAALVLDSRFGLDRGFQLYDDDLSSAEPSREELERYRDGKLVVDAASRWLGEHHESQHKTPFFCWVHLFDPHDPYLPHRDEFGETFDERLYDGEIAYVDMLVGRLLDRLKETKLDEHTIVVVVGDHGESLGEHGEVTHGYMLHEPALRVPLIMYDPRRDDSPYRVETPVSLVDLYPTLADAAAIESKNNTSGTTLAPALVGETINPRDCYAMTDEPYLEAQWSPLRSMVNDRWRYVRTAKPELYDLAAEPEGLINLADRHPEVVAELERQLGEIESRMVRHGGSGVSLTDQERRAIESLGYAGSPVSEEAVPGDVRSLKDIKDMIVYMNRLDEANEFFFREEYDVSSDILKSISRDAPDYFKPKLNLGLCRMMQKRYDEALQWFEQALELNPDSERVHLPMGYCYLQLDDLDEAMRHYLLVLQIRPDSEVAHIYLGQIHLRRGNLAGAVQEFEIVLRLNPRNETAAQALASIRRGR